MANHVCTAGLLLGYGPVEFLMFFLDDIPPFIDISHSSHFSVLCRWQLDGDWQTLYGKRWRMAGKKKGLARRATEDLLVQLTVEMALWSAWWWMPTWAIFTIVLM